MKSCNSIPMKRVVLETLPSANKIRGIDEVTGFDEFDGILFFTVKIQRDFIGKGDEKKLVLDWYDRIKAFLFQNYISIMFDDRCNSGFDYDPKTNRESFVLYLVAFESGKHSLAYQKMQSLKQTGNSKC